MKQRPQLIKLSLSNKIARAIWQLVWAVLYRPSPRIFHGWRRILLKLFGASIGRNAHPYPSAKIWAPWNLIMEENSCLGEHVDCYCVAQVRIGKNSTVSQYSYLCTASHDHTLSSMPLIASRITIGNDVWVTADVFVAPGVTIADGSVITARSNVFRDIPPWVVASGSPAIPIKARIIHPSEERLEQVENK